jgi:hypothetical protein
VFENIGTFHAVTLVMIKEFGLDAFRLKYPLLVEESIFLPEKLENQGKQWETTLEMALTVLKVVIKYDTMKISNVIVKEIQIVIVISGRKNQ